MKGWYVGTVVPCRVEWMVRKTAGSSSCDHLEATGLSEGQSKSWTNLSGDVVANGMLPAEQKLGE